MGKSKSSCRAVRRARGAPRAPSTAHTRPPHTERSACCARHTYSIRYWRGVLPPVRSLLALGGRPVARGVLRSEQPPNRHTTARTTKGPYNCPYNKRASQEIPQSEASPGMTHARCEGAQEIIEYDCMTVEPRVA